MSFTVQRWYPVANLTRYIPIRVYDYYAPGECARWQLEMCLTASNCHLPCRALQRVAVQHPKPVLPERVPRLRLVPVSLLSHLQFRSTPATAERAAAGVAVLACSAARPQQSLAVVALAGRLAGPLQVDNACGALGLQPESRLATLSVEATR